MSAKQSICVYVDGFALYKGLLQRTFPEYKWLNLEQLFGCLYPDFNIVVVKYFSAKVKPLTNNPGVGQRQAVYWRALRTTNLEIVEGKFNFVRQYLPLHPEKLDDEGKVVTVRVKRPEEKGSDVALATHLIFDALANTSEHYAVLTNDSDLVPPIKMLLVRGYKIHLISVNGDKFNKAFTLAGVSSVKKVRSGTLAQSQFPDVIRDANGAKIVKPQDWA